MRVHSLDCGPMRPPVVGRLVCHVLLCETPGGLVLVDSGFGTADLAEPARRLGAARRLLRPTYDPARTALAQVRGLGFAAEDVRHVVLTHLDLDHVGGLSDFPAAVVHTTAAEHRAAVVAPGAQERARYHPAQWEHGPRWQTYDAVGEPWHGLTALPLAGLDASFSLVPMPGHTRGHAAVAVETERGWLLHAGDAAFDRSTLDPAEPRNRALLAFEQVVAWDRTAVAANHRALAALRAGAEVDVVTAHDPVLLDRRTS